MIDIKPEVNCSGEVIPHDHPNIENHHNLIRRIPPLQIHTDLVTGKSRISTAAFSSSSNNGGMSVDLEELLKACLDEPKKFTSNPKFSGAVLHTATTYREKKLKVGYEPKTGNPYHGEVWGKITGGMKKKLARSYAWYVEMPEFDFS